MNEAEFREKYALERCIFKAWGDFVSERITQCFQSENKKEITQFLKIPCIPRLKDMESIIAKAFYRDKNYSDCYNEITDKVGLRYVVLTMPDIGSIAEIITSGTDWNCSQDRDFEEERSKYPDRFTYQSDHYIVKNNAEIDYNGIVIPQGVPCEIQIRTLLQHAYAELTHDTVYKNQVRERSKVHRLIAKSMALMEVTDDLFVQVCNVLMKESNPMDILYSKLVTLYRAISDNAYDEKTNLFILDAYLEELPGIDFVDLEDFIKERKYIVEKIKNNPQGGFLYKQPVVLFLYYMIGKRRHILKAKWPLTNSYIKPLFSDMGVAF